MNIEKYKKQLLAEERRLLDAMDQTEANAKEMEDPPVGDAADESVHGDLKEEQFRNADMEINLLRQVREALKRIADGTYGRCVVDGGVIEEKRLDAMPWTPYCKMHQELLERANPPQTPTL